MTRSGAARGGLAKYLAEPLRVGDPDLVGPLAVYPLFGASTTQAFVAFTQTDESVMIGEVESASVRDLGVTNTGKLPVLLYEGQELLGGQQNRSVDSNVLVAVGAKVQVPVSCVEAGRWDGSRRRARFRASASSPSPQLRRSKSDRVRASLAANRAGYADQGEVWGFIDSISARLGTSSRTRALRDSYDQRARDLGMLADAIRLRDGQLGAIVNISGAFCVLDFVGRPEAFAALHGALVQGYALDAIATDDGESTTSVDDAGRWLGAVLDADGSERRSIGLGTDVRFSSDGVTGSALVYDNDLLALTAFPAAGGGRTSDVRIRRPSGRARGGSR